MEDIYLTFYFKKCEVDDLKEGEECASDEEITAYLETPFMEVESVTFIEVYNQSNSSFSTTSKPLYL